MTELQLREESIFLQALEIESAAARAAFVEQACGNDAPLRAGVEALLRTSDKSGDLLDVSSRPDTSAPTIDQPPAERPGTTIGPYKLLQVIGEGGMGTVYMAEQTRPVERKVALKVIKAGMDTQQVIARFEAERQALAMMDHVNIARVLDVGTTPAGRPYFVMELVHGVPITKYCDDNHLTPRQRLELFVPVCQAIQHAHQKGIIHRDIKPSNVMVTLYDGKPVPKVIDFGVAKATEQKLTERTLFTQYGTMVGTLEYMSPEQAEMSALGVDTRSDIYSLGVLLYELLTGSTPLSHKRVREAAYAEILRMIKEEDPPKPSTRLSDSGEALASISAQRHTEPAKLSKLMRGELDWIVMKTLEKDRNRRYETANGFAADVQRYLNDEPVQACPPSALYRFRKSARRNKVALVTTGLVASALLAGTLISTWQAIRATQAQRSEKLRANSEAKARLEAVQAQQHAVMQLQRAVAAEKQADQERNRAVAAEKQAQAQRDQAEANFAQARKAVDEYFVQVSANQLLQIPGMQPLRQELLRSALAFYEDFIRQRSDDAGLKLELAQTLLKIGQIRRESEDGAGASQAFQDAGRRFQALIAADPSSLESRTGLATCLVKLGKFTEAIASWEELLVRSSGDKRFQKELADTHNFLAVSQNKAKKLAEALVNHQRARDLRVALLASEPDNSQYLAALGSTLNNIGVIMVDRGRPEDALKLYLEGVANGERAHQMAPHVIEHAQGLAIQYSNIGALQARLRQPREAAASFLRSAEVWKSLAARHPTVPSFPPKLIDAYRSAAATFRSLDEPQPAAQAIRQAREVLDRLPRETADDWYVFAQVKALNATPLEGDAAGLDLSDDAERKRDADEALAALKTAVAKGFRDVPRLRRDQELLSLRIRPDFQALVDSLEQSARLAEAEKKPTAEKITSIGDIAQSLAKLSAADPDNARLLASLAQSRYALGVARLGLGETQEAAKLLADARAAQETLLEHQPKTAEHIAALGSTWYALGDVEWKSAHYPQAVECWEKGAAILVRGGTEIPQDQGLKRTLATKEFELIEHFGKHGHWTLAARHWANSKAADRILAGMAGLGEARYAALVALLGSQKSYEELCRLLVEKFSKEDPAHVAWGCTHLPLSSIEPKQILALAERARTENPASNFSGTTLAKAQLRAGQYEPARTKLGSPFLEAIAEFRLGRPEAAQRMLLDADRQYAAAWVKLSTSLAGSAATTSSLPELHGFYWWEATASQLYRREAWQLIEGRLPSDPWQPLIEARAWSRMGNEAEAERSFQACIDADPRNPDVWILRAKVRAQLADHPRALADLAQAIELDPKRAESWIARGRCRAEQGQQQQADLDFAQAAALAPQELNKFVEAGWWVAGPFPAGIAAAETLEEHPEPSVPPSPPAKAQPPATPDQPPPAWRAVLPDVFGTLQLAPYFPAATDQTCYLLTFVASPDERTLDLVLGGNGPRRVWLNGQLVHESAVVTNTSSMVTAPRVKLRLKAGRNSLLVKAALVQGQGWLDARLSDSVLDRAISYTEQRQFAEALPLWNQLAEKTAFAYVLRCAALCAAAAGDDAALQQAAETMRNRLGHTQEPYTAQSVVFGWSVSGRAYPDQAQWDHLVELVRGKKMSMWMDAVGLADYRRGSHARALEALVDADVETYPPRWPVIALVQNALGNDKEARRWLEKASAWRDSPAADDYRNVLPRYMSLATCTAYFEALYREAATKITGSVPARDRIGQLVRLAQSLSDAGELRPADDAFAKAVEHDPQRAETWIARGRALAQRGEHKLADADFAQAAALAPQELNKFIEAGWWVAGPYPAELATACPPEQTPDPSRPPAPVVDGITAGAAEVKPFATWRQAATDPLGRVQLKTLFPSAANLSCYLLTHVASPDEREMNLLVGSDGPRRVWLNGELVHESAEPTVWNLGLKTVLLKLRTGRNTLLIKASHAAGAQFLDCRLNDSLVERALALTERRSFSEALPLWDRLGEQNKDMFIGRCAALCAAAAGDEAGYAQASDRLRQRYGNTTSPHGAYAVILGCGATARPYPDDAQWNRLRELVGTSPDALQPVAVALAEYRAGRYAEALQALTRPESKTRPVDLPLWALIHHALGHDQEAAEWLAKAREMLERPLAERPANAVVTLLEDRADHQSLFQALYREAATKITGAAPVPAARPATKLDK